MPIQPVRIVTPCGSETGIPIPSNIVRVIMNPAAVIDVGGSQNFINAVWSAVETRWLLYFYFYMVTNTPNQGRPFLDWHDFIRLNISVDGVVYTFYLKDPMIVDNIAGGFTTEGYLVLPFPIMVPLGSTLIIRLDNLTLGQIAANSTAYVFYIPV